MTITIPPAALEAGARAICEMEYGACDGGDTNPCSCTYWAAHARAAFLAIVENWEGAKTIRDDGRRQTYAIPALILPLPQEASNDQ